MADPLTYTVSPISFTDMDDEKYWPETFVVKLSNSFSFFFEAFSRPLLIELLSPCCTKIFAESDWELNTYTCDSCGVGLAPLLTQPFCYTGHEDMLAAWMGGEPLASHLHAVQLMELVQAVADEAKKARGQRSTLLICEAETLAIEKPDLFSGVLL